MSSATKSSDSKEYSIVEFNFKKWIGVLFKDGFSEPIDVTIADLSDVHEEDGDIFVTVENKRGKIVAQSGIYTLALFMRLQYKKHFARSYVLSVSDLSK